MPHAGLPAGRGGVGVKNTLRPTLALWVPAPCGQGGDMRQVPPTFPTLWDTGGLERRWHAGPRGLQDVQGGDGAAGAAQGGGHGFPGRGAVLLGIWSG